MMNKDVAENLDAFVKAGGKLIATEGGAAKLASMEWTGIKLDKRFCTKFRQHHTKKLWQC